jgi:hypothetical protein
MSVVVIGADHLGSIEKNLHAIGVHELVHISGRKPLCQNNINIPQRTSFILVMTDYINHNTAINVKEVAKTKNVPLVYAKRSWSAVRAKLSAMGLVK